MARKEFFSSKPKVPKSLGPVAGLISITGKLYLSILRRGCCPVVVNLGFLASFELVCELVTVIKWESQNGSIDALFQLLWHIGYKVH